MADFHTTVFAWHCVLSVHPPMLLWIITWEIGGMPLHNVAGKL